MNHEDCLGNLLEHVEILAHKVSELKIPSDLTIATQTGAKASIEYLTDMQEKIRSYQRTAQILKDAMNIIPLQELASRIR